MGSEILVKEVDASNRYWLVRTYGGKYYSHFVQNNYIAIGWNEISNLEQIKEAGTNGKVKEELLAKARKFYIKKETEKPGSVVNPIMRFVNEMSIGDVVVIPSENSKEIHFGVIKSNAKIVKDVINLDPGLDPLFKQRTVEWITWREKDSVDLNIFKMLSSHQAMSNVDDYSDSIDRTMYSLYVKGDRAHAVIKVGKEGEYTGTEIPDLINALLGTIDIYNEVTGESVSKSDVKMKISLQSDGFVFLFGNPEIIMIILGIAIAMTGGGYKIKTLKEGKWSKKESHTEVVSSGLIDAVSNAMLKMREQKHRHKIEEKEQEFRHILTALNMQLPTFDGTTEISSVDESSDEKE